MGKWRFPEMEVPNHPFDAGIFHAKNIHKFGYPHNGKTQIHHHPSKVLQAVLPRNASLILDLCAAPGSKSTQLAHDFAGTVVANEPDLPRAGKLRANFLRMGLTKLEKHETFRWWFWKVLLFPWCAPSSPEVSVFLQYNDIIDY